MQNGLFGPPNNWAPYAEGMGLVRLSTKRFTGGGNSFRIVPPPWAKIVKLYGCGGGGGGGCTSGGVPSIPTAGEASRLYYAGLTVSLGGGAAGQNNAGGTSAGGTASYSQNYRTVDIFDRQDLPVRLINTKHIELADVVGSGAAGVVTTGGNSQFTGYGKGGDGAGGNGLGGGGGAWVDEFVLYLYRDLPLSFYLGKGGTPGAGDTIGSPGLPGFFFFEFFGVPDAPRRETF